MKRLLCCTTLLAGFTLYSATAAGAQGQGANPSGKPFVELQGQIIEVEGEMASLQDQIDSLVGRVDTMEGRISANQQAIADLTATSATLQGQIDANADDIVSLEADIAALVSQNAELQEQIDANAGSIEDLEDQLSFNEGLIAAMRQSISELGTDLQDQIDNNAALIAALQAEIDGLNELLALKSLLDNQECPFDYAMREVLSDGSVICEDTGGGGTVGIEWFVSWKNVIAPANKITVVQARCPNGYIVTGGGYNWLWGEGPFRQEPLPPHYWRVTGRNNLDYDIYVMAIGQCIRLTQ